jgi:hypothetical protein
MLARMIKLRRNRANWLEADGLAAIEEFEEKIAYRMQRATPNISRREAILRLKKVSGTYSWSDFKWEMGLPEDYKIQHD